ncbi:MAG TPA: selenide, water dikinase SelD, partial [Vicinamibacterales bacterium]|nr:selenide, water dikinase SelD [Vicinamibacterales bacterium]
GQIAAANALSDVYAMGGSPLTALAIAAFPKEVDRALLKAIFAGGLDKLREAGVALLGGHTVQDQEIKFGYAVTGEVDPARIWTNAAARAGDALILTKPIGTGVIATALKFERAPAAAVDAAVRSMVALNRAATETLQSLRPDSVHACTDVTGFGLIGHASEMAAASGCSLEIDVAEVPMLPGARELVHANTPGGGRTNAEHFGGAVRVERAVDPDLFQLLYDPQTSGGLLVAVNPARLDTVLAALAGADVGAAQIGRVVPVSVTDSRVILR